MSNRNWRALFGWTEVQVDELRLAGYSYIRQGKYDMALDFFEALVILDNEKPYNWQTLGALHLELGNTDKAIETLTKALDMAPNHAGTLLNFTKALFMKGKIEEGLRNAEKLKNHDDRRIASFAKALLLAYS